MQVRLPHDVILRKHSPSYILATIKDMFIKHYLSSKQSTLNNNNEIPLKYQLSVNEMYTVFIA